jgi:hypothetical protein
MDELRAELRRLRAALETIAATGHRVESVSEPARDGDAYAVQVTHRAGCPGCVAKRALKGGA